LEQLLADLELNHTSRRPGGHWIEANIAIQRERRIVAEVLSAEPDRRSGINRQSRRRPHCLLLSALLPQARPRRPSFARDIDYQNCILSSRPCQARHCPAAQPLEFAQTQKVEQRPLVVIADTFELAQKAGTITPGEGIHDRGLRLLQRGARVAPETRTARARRRDRRRIRVHSYPPGTSKWNKIEHRTFCHVTQNWRGRLLFDRFAVVELIGATTTTTGLKVESALDTRSYQNGIKVSKAQMKCLNIAGHQLHPE
jgi:hypothetical protein